jgi:hypothetical protein
MKEKLRKLYNFVYNDFYTSFTLISEIIIGGLRCTKHTAQMIGKKNGIHNLGVENNWRQLFLERHGYSAVTKRTEKYFLMFLT